MFGSIIDNIQKQHGEKALIGVYLCIINEIKTTLNQQQKELDKIKKQYSKIDDAKQAFMDLPKKLGGRNFDSNHREFFTNYLHSKYLSCG